MQAQAYDGYVENGRFYPENALKDLQGRFKAVLTVLDVPASDESTDWVDRLNEMIAESSGEELHMENFPRADLTREHPEVRL